MVAPGLEEEAGLELGGSFSGGRFLDPSGEGEGGAEISILDRRLDGGGEYWRHIPFKVLSLDTHARACAHVPLSCFPWGCLRDYS